MVAGAYIAYLDSIQNNNSYTNRELIALSYFLLHYFVSEGISVRSF